MLPVIAIVGCPNVGKSTLFNRLTGTRDALVADYPGLTRDRLYGFADAEAGPAIIVDTGGLTGGSAAVDRAMQVQVGAAVEEADAVIMLVDGSSGLGAGDEAVAALLRRSGKPVVLAVNKTEGVEPHSAVADFHALGLGEPLAISASRGERIGALMNAVLACCAPTARAAVDGAVPVTETASGGIVEPAAGNDATRIAILGRPNVGKSTLVNRYLGEERVITLDEAGTTRDSIEIPFEADDRRYVLVDTAGIRRKARVTAAIEKISIAKSLKALDEADAVIVLCDARDGITDQDVSLIGLVLERGRALALGINKWDGLTAAQRATIRSELDRQLPFLDFVDTHFISARHGSNIYDLLAPAFGPARGWRRGDA